MGGKISRCRSKSLGCLGFCRWQHGRRRLDRRHQGQHGGRLNVWATEDDSDSVSHGHSKYSLPNQDHSRTQDRRSKSHRGHSDADDSESEDSRTRRRLNADDNSRSKDKRRRLERRRVNASPYEDDSESQDMRPYNASHYSSPTEDDDSDSEDSRTRTRRRLNADDNSRSKDKRRRSEWRRVNASPYEDDSGSQDMRPSNASHYSLPTEDEDSDSEDMRIRSFDRRHPLGSDASPSPNEDDSESQDITSRTRFNAYYSSSPSDDDSESEDMRYRRRVHASHSIADNYNSLEEVTQALADTGLESFNLIIGIDFTRSNEWTGAKSFNKKSLHHVGDNLNPYEHAISIIGNTLPVVDEDNMIPCFGFGDASTHDQDVFSFYPDEGFCNGLEDVLNRYCEIVPHLQLAGPTSFAPIIEMAMTIVEKRGGQYHVLVIIADGQVTRSVDTERGKLSPQEQKTMDAIVEASYFPLSIILVGVGDGPWDIMKEFEKNIPSRPFDNFHFVNFTEIMSKNVASLRKEIEFAVSALMEIPSQYKATIELSILGGQDSRSLQRVPLPPPVYGASSPSGFEPYHPTSFQPSVPSAPPLPEESISMSSAPPAPNSTDGALDCPICLSNRKDMVFDCGHQTCCECGPELQTCPICRRPISIRIKVYH